MSREIVVTIDDLSKKYRLFSSPAERLKESLHPFRKVYHREFWALKDISFKIFEGEVIGLLGRNGSGKSTLLQLIAGVLQPTSGTVTVAGRVAAILELGAGFNSEFTGRQNALLNGAILGLSEAQMAARMDAIAAFADIGDFFDQPMKTYSSGMFMRVAFATATCIDPDVLIIDEALAVGDAKFQHKCFERLAAFQSQGKTIVLVSHDAYLISNHCSRVLMLEDGRLTADGEPRKVVDKYIELLFGGASSNLIAESANGKAAAAHTASPGDSAVSQFVANGAVGDQCRMRRGYHGGETLLGDGSAEIVDYLLEAQGRADVDVIRAGETVRILIKSRFQSSVAHPIAGFAIKTAEGVELYGTNTFMLGIRVQPAQRGDLRVFQFQFRAHLNAGDVFIDLGVAEVDGTPGGRVLAVRRSVIHARIVKERISSTGLTDLMPEFSDLSDRNLSYLQARGGAGVRP